MVLYLDHYDIKLIIIILLSHNLADNKCINKCNKCISSVYILKKSEVKTIIIVKTFWNLNNVFFY